MQWQTQNFPQGGVDLPGRGASRCNFPKFPETSGFLRKVLCFVKFLVSSLRRSPANHVQTFGTISNCKMMYYWRIYQGRALGPSQSNFSHFVQLLGKMAKIIGWRTSYGVGAPVLKSWIRHCIFITIVDSEARKKKFNFQKNCSWKQFRFKLQMPNLVSSFFPTREKSPIMATFYMTVWGSTALRLQKILAQLEIPSTFEPKL